MNSDNMFRTRLTPELLRDGMLVRVQLYDTARVVGEIVYAVVGGELHERGRWMMPSREELAAAYAEVKDLRRVATTYHVSRETVRHWMQDYGLEVQPQGRPRKKVA